MPVTSLVPSITLGVSIITLFKLLAIITINPYYYVFETAQLADKLSF